MKLCRIFEICAAVIISGTVGFAEGLTPAKPAVNDACDAVLISGTYASDEAVNIIILNAGKDITDLNGEDHDEVSKSESLYIADELICDTEASFGAEYSMENKRQGKYVVYYTANGESVFNDFWFVRPDKIESWVSEIKAQSNSAAVKAYLFNPSDALEDGTNVLRAELMGIDCSDADFNEFLASFLADSKALYDNYLSFKKTVELSKAAYLIKTGNTTELVDADLKLAESIWEDEQMLPIVNIYNNILSTTGRNLALADLKNMDISSDNKFKTEFIKSCAVHSINNAANQGFGHINNVISETNNLIDMNIAEYFSLSNTQKNNVDSNLLKVTITDFKQMCSTVKTYAKQQAYNTSGGTQGGGGGGGSGKNPSTAIGAHVMEHTTDKEKTEENKNSIFDDMTGYEWAEKAVLKLYETGIISGASEKAFEPGRKVTREEFIKMLLESIDAELTEQASGFSDVDENEWYNKYIAAAEKNGLVKGKNDGSFGVGESITREDCCVFIARAKGFDNSTAELTFVDTKEVSEYAKAPLAAVKEMGIVSGDDNNYFNPKGFCTRAEAAVMIYRMLQ